MKYCFLFLVLALVIIQYPCSADVVDDMTVGYEFITVKTNEDFTVSFYYKSGISHHDWIIPVQNLEGDNRYVNISSFIQKTNFDTDEIENLQFFEYKLIPYTYTIDHYDYVNYSEWNETNQTWNNWTEQTLNWTETIESEKLDWKACKSNLFKSTGKELRDDYGEILIPKFGSKDKGDGTINGTKIFRVSYDTPIVRMGDGWGSSGEFAMLVDDIRFCPWWSGSWDRRRELVIDHNMVDADMTNFPVMVSIIQLGLNADGNDTRITDSSGNQVAREIECYNETSGELVFFLNGTSISSTSDTSFWMYYNNSAATEPAADSTYGSQAVYGATHDAVYHMNGLIDSTLNGRTCTIVGTVTQSEGEHGKEYDFQGSTDYMHASTGITAFPFTIMNRMKLHTVSDYMPFIYLNDASDCAVYYGVRADVATPRNYRIDARGNGISEVTASTTLDVVTGSYVIVHAVYASATDRKVYINGVVEATSTGSVTFDSDIDKFLIGQTRMSAPITNTLDGVVSEARSSSVARSVDYISTCYNNLNNPTATGTDPFFTSFGAEEEYVAPTPTPTPAPTTPASPAQYDELDFPLILYILTISMLYLLIAFKHGIAAVELSLIYLIFAFFFLLLQTISISVNYIYLTLFLLLFLISIAGITKQGAD